MTGPRVLAGRMRAMLRRWIARRAAARRSHLVPGCLARVLGDGALTGRVVRVVQVTSDWDGDFAWFDTSWQGERRRFAARFDCSPPEIERLPGESWGGVAGLDRGLALKPDLRRGGVL